MIHSAGSSTEEDEDQLDALQYFINQLATSGLTTDMSGVTEETYHNILSLAVELREVSAVVFVYRHMVNTVGCRLETYRIMDSLYGKEGKNRIHLPLEFDRQRSSPGRQQTSSSEMLKHVGKIKGILSKNPTLQTKNKALAEIAMQLYQIESPTVIYIMKYLETRGELATTCCGQVGWKRRHREFWPDAT